MADIRRRRRRWSRYTLQGTLLLALLLAIPCSWLAVKMERAERQLAVVEEFENLGGVVWYDYQFDRADIPNAEQAEPPGPPWLRRLLGDDFFTNVTKLDLMQTEIGDAALNDLEVLSELQSLSLGERVSDAGLAHLRGLAQLQTLDLRKTQVTDAGIQGLQKSLPNCKICR